MLYSEPMPLQWTDDIIIRWLLRRNDVTTSFWQNNYVFITSCVRSAGLMYVRLKCINNNSSNGLMSCNNLQSALMLSKLSESYCAINGCSVSESCLLLFRFSLEPKEKYDLCIVSYISSCLSDSLFQELKWEHYKQENRNRSPDRNMKYNFKWMHLDILRYSPWLRCSSFVSIKRCVCYENLPAGPRTVSDDMMCGYFA